MQGGMIVAGLVTGGYTIEDIATVVPHKTATFIPAEKVLRSKDLYRALGQNLLFKLDGGGFGQEAAPPVPDASSITIARLEAENKALRAQNELLQKLLTGLQEQLSALQQGVARLEQRPTTVVVNNDSGRAAPAVEPTVVGGDTPTFLPGSIAPKDAEAQIRVEKQVAENSSVGAAGSKLREMRRKSGG